jgi:hypothetical protein
MCGAGRCGRERLTHAAVLSIAVAKSILATPGMIDLCSSTSLDTRAYICCELIFFVPEQSKRVPLS